MIKRYDYEKNYKNYCRSNNCFSCGGGDFFLNFSNEKGVAVVIDNEEIKTAVPPQMINGNMMVPLREIGEALGAEIKWNNTEKNVEIRKEWSKISLDIASKYYIKDETEKMSDTAPVLLKKRILVPLTFIETEFQCASNWNEDGTQISIERMNAYDILINHFKEIGSNQIDFYDKSMYTILEYRENSNLFIIMNGFAIDTSLQSVMAVFGEEGENITFDATFKNSYEHSEISGKFKKNNNSKNSAITDSHTGTRDKELALASALSLIKSAGEIFDNYFEENGLNIQMSDLGIMYK